MLTSYSDFGASVGGVESVTVIFQHVECGVNRLINTSIIMCCTDYISVGETGNRNVQRITGRL